MKQILLVFAGGGFGSILRYILGKYFNTLEYAIPYGTLLANILGSLLIGLLAGYFIKISTISDNYSLLLITGFCGGFTTFSAFTLENQVLLKNGDYFQFLLYTFSSVFFGIGAVFLGWFLAKFI